MNSAKFDKTLVLIPARMASTRLPGKPLADIAGLPMIVQVARRAAAADVGRVVVAVDDQAVFDAVGGPIFEPLTAAMSLGGILIEYGGLSPEATPFPLFAALSKTLTLRGYRVNEIIGDPVRSATARKFILDGLASGALKPVISRTFPFERIVDAHRFLESNEQFGKIVVTV